MSGDEAVILLIILALLAGRSGGRGVHVLPRPQGPRPRPVIPAPKAVIGRWDDTPLPPDLPDE